MTNQVGKVTPARVAAFEILRGVGEGRGHSDELLHAPRMGSLSREDKNLTTALVMGVLRWQIALDAQIRPLLQRPDAKLAEAVAISLRMGAFQLLHMDRIPAHAALSESVELCRAAGEPHAAGMVNAVLRKIASAPKQSPKLYETPAAFAERLGHPAWMVERWVKIYGRATAMKICEADQKERGEGGMFSVYGDELPQMDDGSRLVAELAAAAVPWAKRVWDSCAAPGGKTLVLSRRLPDAAVLATDVSAKRVSFMEKRLRDLDALEVECGVADAAMPDAVEGEFDLILCDVPCTGTGTMAANPEIRHRLEPAEIGRQAQRQEKIVRNALKQLARGGRLVYSTCSLEPEECEAVVAEIEGKKLARRVDVGSVLPGLAGVLASGVELDSVVRDGAVRTLPGVHACDGFYAVVLER